MRNCALRGCLIVVFAFCFILLENIGRAAQSRVKPQPNTQQTQQQPQADKRGTLDAPFVVKPLPTEKNQQEAEEDARDKSEKRWNDRVTIFVAVATAVILIFQLIVFGWQAHRLKQTIQAMKKIGADQSRDMQKSIAAAEKSAEIAERAVIAAHRPWVKVDIQVGGPIIYNVNGANFTLKYILKNIGHSPATNVNVSPRVIFPILDPEVTENFNPRAELQKHIVELKKRLPSPFGFALFPEEIIIQVITVTMPQDEIKRATKMTGAIYPRIIGAVDYRIGLDDKPHQTGFMVEIRRNDVPRPATIANNRSQPAIFIDEGDVPASEVRLFRSILEGGYAD